MLPYLYLMKMIKVKKRKVTTNEIFRAIFTWGIVRQMWRFMFIGAVWQTLVLLGILTILALIFTQVIFPDYPKP